MRQRGARGMLKVILPWPARVLHPNARPHWSVKAKAAKAARATAYALALQAGAMRMQWPDGRLHLWIDFYPPDRRRRDDDGLLASVKAARDGMADAMGIDDHRFVSHPMLREEVRKGGQVVMTVTGGPCAA